MAHCSRSSSPVASRTRTWRAHRATGLATARHRPAWAHNPSTLSVAAAPTPPCSAAASRRAAGGRPAHAARHGRGPSLAGALTNVATSAGRVRWLAAKLPLLRGARGQVKCPLARVADMSAQRHQPALLEHTIDAAGVDTPGNATSPAPPWPATTGCWPAGPAPIAPACGRVRPAAAGVAARRTAHRPGFGHAVPFMGVGRVGQPTHTLGHAASGDLLRQIVQRLRRPSAVSAVMHSPWCKKACGAVTQPVQWRAGCWPRWLCGVSPGHAQAAGAVAAQPGRAAA